MPSLRQLHAAFAPLLLLDAAGSRVHVGLFPAGPTLEGRWFAEDDEAGQALFHGVAALGADPGAIGGFLFCEAPGSVLGIRTAAMAIRTWCALQARPVFAYQALAVLAEGSGRPDRTWIADARREAWHRFVRGGSLLRMAAADLAPGPFATPLEFRRWSVLPSEVETVPYDLPRLLATAADADLFHPTGEPEAFLHAEPTYATWTAQVHGS
jgi:tRNA threonylcarbamoyladenosine biosynthesis protein TsaB